jgi:hypothetical protein
MDVVFWLVAYVVGFGLVQLLLYRYFRRDDPAPDATPRRREAPTPVAVGESDDETSGVHCGECGTYNEHDSMFVYCRSCANRLS